jgi:thiol-disulfide isomerase/thioredoxin
MRYKTNIPLRLILFTAGMLLHFVHCSPPEQDASGPLKPGDPVPDLLLKDVLNYPGETARLSDFDGKLLILDFWATWCHPCIEAIPRLEQLQREFDGQLQFLMVTSQDKSMIAKFFAARKVSLPSVTGDTALSELFPHNHVPHEVWIKDGKVVAITGEAEVTAENIRDRFSPNATPLAEKKSNFDYDPIQPLLVNGNGGQASDLQYHSVITGYLDGIGGGGVFTDSLNRYKLRALNGTAVQLYRTAMRYLGDGSLAQANRCIQDFDRQQVLPPPGVAAYSPAARDRYYCYELIVPSDLKAQAGQLMLDDLNRFFGSRYQLRAAVEKRTVQCWVLKHKGNPERLLSKSAKPEIINDEPNRLVYRRQPFENFYRAVTGLYKDNPYPVIDRTGLTGEIDISFPTDVKDIRLFSAAVKPYGLYLEQERCEIDLLVIQQFD